MSYGPVLHWVAWLLRSMFHVIHNSMYILLGQERVYTLCQNLAVDWLRMSSIVKGSF